MAEAADVPPPLVVRGVLDAALFESLRFYVAELARSRALKWEEWGHRWIRHNDPLAVLVHQSLTPRVAELVGRPVRRSYVFLACYEDGGHVPPHRDRAQCRYTLDLCLAADGGAWPLFVDGRPYTFGANEALLYRGCEQVHHREPKPAGVTSHLAFFHFVDPDFEGPLD